MEGWKDIIETMKEISEPYDVKWLQIKEKFGTLRAYFSCPTEYHDLVSDIVGDAETLSSITCLGCGEPGKLCNLGYWVLTLCDECLEIKVPKKPKGLSPLDLIIGKPCGECEANRGEG
jgi:hypothetical protein